MTVLNKALLQAYAQKLKLGTDQDSLVKALQSAGVPSTHILQWIENPASMPVTYSASILRKMGGFQTPEVEEPVEEKLAPVIEPTESAAPIPTDDTVTNGSGALEPTDEPTDEAVTDAPIDETTDETVTDPETEETTDVVTDPANDEVTE